MTGSRTILVALLLAGSSPAHAQSPQWDDLKPGAYGAGFRMIETFDRGRTVKPPTDYAGRTATEAPGVPMQLGVWYPAVRRPGSRPMSYFELLLAVRERPTFGPQTAADSAATRQFVTQTVGFAGGDTTRSDARPAAVLSRATASLRGAPPARGKFPVVILASGGAIGGTTVLAEYLATHGWIVVSTQGQTLASGALQPTEPALAIDVGVNAIAFALATAHTISNADAGRVGVIGFNFDSFSALDYQARYMRASVLVTINGWESIDQRAETLRNSLWYDPARIRVPVLNIHWDERGAAPANLTYLESLKYSERRNITISGLDHFGLIGNPLAYQYAKPAHRSGYQYLIRAVHATLANAIAGSNDVVRDLFLSRPPAEAGFAPDVLKNSWSRPALPPVPTRAEFFEIIGDRRDLQTATRLFREARTRDSTVQLFSESEMNLAAFRFQRAGQLDNAIAVHRLAVDAYPKSSNARNGLGNMLLLRADTAAAVREFEAAITLLDANSVMSAEEKANQARVWREKIARLKPSGEFD